MASTISHKRLAPFGIEVTVNVARALSAEDKAEIRRLYALDGLIVFRDLQLSMEEQVAFCTAFGPVLRGEFDNFMVSNVRKDGLFGDMELHFHHDIPYVPAPFLAGALHAVEVDEGVSGTMYASGFRAYERLPQKLRDRIANLNALFVRPRREDRRTRLTDLTPTDNCAVHAVVSKQKGTNRPYVFVNTSSTGCVIGLTERESDALLEELFAHIYAPDNIYEHKWKRGDLVIWDNLALQHARKAVSGGVRTLQRTTVAELGYAAQYPVDVPAYTDLREGRGFRATDSAA